MSIAVMWKLTAAASHATRKIIPDAARGHVPFRLLSKRTLLLYIILNIRACYRVNNLRANGNRMTAFLSPAAQNLCRAPSNGTAPMGTIIFTFWIDLASFQIIHCILEKLLPCCCVYKKRSLWSAVSFYFIARRAQPTDEIVCVCISKNTERQQWYFKK